MLVTVFTVGVGEHNSNVIIMIIDLTVGPGSGGELLEPYRTDVRPYRRTTKV